MTLTLGRLSVLGSRSISLGAFSLIAGRLPAPYPTLEHFDPGVSHVVVLGRQTGGACLPQSGTVEVDPLVLGQPGQLLLKLLLGDRALQLERPESHIGVVGAHKQRLPAANLLVYEVWGDPRYVIGFDLLSKGRRGVSKSTIQKRRSSYMPAGGTGACEEGRRDNSSRNACCCIHPKPPLLQSLNASV